MYLAPPSNKKAQDLTHTNSQIEGQQEYEQSIDRMQSAEQWYTPFVWWIDQQRLYYNEKNE